MPEIEIELENHPRREPKTPPRVARPPLRTVHFTLVDLSGEVPVIRERGTCLEDDLEGQRQHDGQMIVEGEWHPDKWRFDPGTGGFVAYTPPLTDRQIKDECRRRILAEFSFTDQINAALAGGDRAREALTFINANIEKCAELIALPERPTNIRDYEGWPVAPGKEAVPVSDDSAKSTR